MNDQNLIFNQKIQLREILKKKRAEISNSEKTYFSKIITDHLLSLEQLKKAETVFAYISYSTEVETHQLIQSLLASGKKVLVPKIIDSQVMHSQQLNNWAELKPGKLGILTPGKGEIYTLPIDVAITPGLGFTLEGHRIGFGAGYYDRWFSSHKVKLKIAIAFEKQIIESLPIEETDVAIDVLLTEKRFITVK